MVFLSFIFGFVLYVLAVCLRDFSNIKFAENSEKPAVKLTHASVIEII